MNQLQEQIARFQKMTAELPDDDLGHFRLGQFYMEDGQFEQAAKSFRRTLELNPQFSKVYQLLGVSLIKLGRLEEAVTVLREGFKVADDRGDNVPRDEIVKLLVQLGQPAPVSERASKPAAGPAAEGPGTGFRCQRPGCFAGSHARQLSGPPFSDELGQKIYEQVCADCWDYWKRNLSIKVVNEARIDLSDERGAALYDQIMRETLGLT
jgi:tetratricopeptide (TPR) repeat protein